MWWHLAQPVQQVLLMQQGVMQPDSHNYTCKYQSDHL
jgi:hypothetical protein